MTKEQKIRRARLGGKAKWQKATAADRAYAGAILNNLSPEKLSQRNRANVLSRWAKQRKADLESAA